MMKLSKNLSEACKSKKDDDHNEKIPSALVMFEPQQKQGLFHGKCWSFINVQTNSDDVMMTV